MSAETLILLPCSILRTRYATTAELNHVHYALSKRSARMHTRPHFPVIFSGLSVYWGKCPSSETRKRTTMESCYKPVDAGHTTKMHKGKVIYIQDRGEFSATDRAAPA